MYMSRFLRLTSLRVNAYQQFISIGGLPRVRYFRATKKKSAGNDENDSTDFPGPNTLPGRIIMLEKEHASRVIEVKNLRSTVEDGFRRVDQRCEDGFRRVDKRFEELNTCIRWIVGFGVGTIGLGLGGMILKVSYYDSQARAEMLAAIDTAVDRAVGKAITRMESGDLKGVAAGKAAAAAAAQSAGKA